eukprot:1195743-Prorocentrum_minimum.AAC.9
MGITTYLLGNIALIVTKRDQTPEKRRRRNTGPLSPEYALLPPKNLILPRCFYGHHMSVSSPTWKQEPS